MKSRHSTFYATNEAWQEHMVHWVAKLVIRKSVCGKNPISYKSIQKYFENKKKIKIYHFVVSNGLHLPSKI